MISEPGGYRIKVVGAQIDRLGKQVSVITLCAVGQPKRLFRGQLQVARQVAVMLNDLLKGRSFKEVEVQFAT